MKRTQVSNSAEHNPSNHASLSLAAALRELRAQLEARIFSADITTDDAEVTARDAKSERAEASKRKTKSAARTSVEIASDNAQLNELVNRFSLSNFERDILLLCAGVELDASFAALVRKLQQGTNTSGPTFGLALAALRDAHWSALAPISALRRWKLIHMQARAGVTGALLRIDERILHFLTGVLYFEPKLQPVIKPVSLNAELSPSHIAPARAMVAAWVGNDALEQRAIVVLTGQDSAAHEAVAVKAAASVGLQLHRLPAASIPQDAAERVALARLWEREAMLMHSALLIVLDHDASEDLRIRVQSAARELSGILAISSTERMELRDRAVQHIVVAPPTAADQTTQWKRALGARAAEFNGSVERVAAQFQLDSAAIDRAASEVLAQTDADITASLWRACRREVRPALGSLAQVIEPRARWDDLVLPDAQKHLLRTIVAQVRQRERVAEEWGFARKSERGLGIHALFAGPSGTGKTMAAEVIANELALDLFRIDLSAVVSKYIGETEKNLQKLFDAAERAGAVLLFDEADALFGKRSEVRDSHDRYANIEVSYLLQRFESYRGLAILTTNFKTGIDAAFARRIRFTVQFPFPDELLRREIWRGVFPVEMPREGVDVDKLAKLSLSGGHIRNVALNAAFLAADSGEPVRMHHLAAAAQAEHNKLDRQLNGSDLAGWS